MRSVYRYEVPIDGQRHSFELIGDPLAVAMVPTATRQAVVEFWSEFEDERSVKTRWFQVFGTGQAIPDDAVWRGTTARLNGLVWHLYEVMRGIEEKVND